MVDGSEFSGKIFGWEENSTGEVVFTTGMTGFEQSITDPSFAGQILVFTFPLVGNYGIPSENKDKNGILENFESKNPFIKGLVVSDFSENFSHHSAKKSIQKWLQENKIPGICGIDTRKLTQKIRESGSILGQIVIENSKIQKKIIDPNLGNLAKNVSTKKLKILEPENFSGISIAAIDTGIKNNILREFLQRGIKIFLCPIDFSIEQIYSEISGVFLANGPGDPKIIFPEIQKNILWAAEKNLPIFGICLGNQLINLSFGGNTFKMKFGHRGVNQPVQNLQNRKCFITSQNHGFAIDPEKIPKNFKIWFKNLNDNSVEGIRHKNERIFSVQFHPEAFPGPQETNYLFDEFVEVIQSGK